MFVQGINTLSNKPYNSNKPSFKSNPSEILKTLEKGADEFRRAANEVAEELTDVQRQRIIDLAYKSEPNYTTADSFLNETLFGTDF